MAASSRALTLINNELAPQETAERKYALELFASVNSLVVELLQALSISDADEQAFFGKPSIGVTPTLVMLGTPDNPETYEQPQIYDLASLQVLLATRIANATTCSLQEREAGRCLSILRQVAYAKTAMLYTDREENFKVQIFYIFLHTTFTVYDRLMAQVSAMNAARALISAHSPIPRSHSHSNLSTTSSSSDTLSLFSSSPRSPSLPSLPSSPAALPSSTTLPSTPITRQTCEKFLQDRLADLVSSLRILWALQTKLTATGKHAQAAVFLNFLLRIEPIERLSFNRCDLTPEDATAIAYAFVGSHLSKLDIRDNPRLNCISIQSIIKALNVDYGFGVSLLHNLTEDTVNQLICRGARFDTFIYSTGRHDLSWQKPQERYLVRTLSALSDWLQQKCLDNFFPTYSSTISTGFFNITIEGGEVYKTCEGGRECRIPATIKIILEKLERVKKATEQKSPVLLYKVINSLYKKLDKNLSSPSGTQAKITAVFYHLLFDNLKQFCRMPLSNITLLQLANRLIQLMPILVTLNGLMCRIEDPRQLAGLFGFLTRDPDTTTLDLSTKLLSSEEVAAIAYVLPGSHITALNLGNHSSFTSLTSLTTSTHSARVTEDSLLLLVQAIAKARGLVELNLMGLPVSERMYDILMTIINSLDCKITLVLLDDRDLGKTIHECIMARLERIANQPASDLGSSQSNIIPVLERGETVSKSPEELTNGMYEMLRATYNPRSLF